MWKILVICIVITGLAAEDMISYEGYKVFSIIPTTSSQLRVFNALKKANNKVDKYSFWQGPSSINKEVIIMVSPHVLSEFFEILDISNTSHKIKFNNVQKLIKKTMPKNQSQSFDFESYHTLDEIYNNLEELAKKYSDKVQVVVGGRTYEGREIKGVKITSGEEKPGIFIEGGMHGRDWISPATVMYILHQLLTSKNPDVRYVADNHNWYIFPIFNPDGYAYTFIKNRLWKKTLKPSSLHPDCIGSDPNRNWDFRWNTTGVSNNPCAEDYPGESPFSEIEMKTMSEYIKVNARYFYAYVSFHSFGQRLMFPYGYTETHIFSYDKLYRVGLAAIAALEKVHGTKYWTGCLGEDNGM
ncbi:PREDICTED: zinc carboxypeptidase A 1-like [Wasmannia auropunctata]|uniref:zinc carboxypeptidase A 1-like n=1 Tax=Wasmannia auropunctata TaxID=64793 RepID=UPI0005EEACE3|nr:PREDICTED: zinc carboxypeptidase A 1-like [Wasmannia auropunctata]